LGFYKKFFLQIGYLSPPERGAFEDVKDRTWKVLGGENYRIMVEDLPKISASMIRKALDEKDLNKLKSFLTSGTCHA